METIKHSAIKAGEIIFVGHRHHNIFCTLYECGYEPEQSQKMPQGFVTSTGRFVDRKEGAQIALAQNQIINRDRFNPNELFSEDLY